MSALPMRFCTHCGTERVPGEEFCEDCGAVIDDGTPTVATGLDLPDECDECGRSLPPRWRFCGRCGTPNPTAARRRPRRIDDVAGWVETSPGAVLTPEVVDEPGVELISRSSPADLPSDAPVPPAPRGPGTPPRRSSTPGAGADDAGARSRPEDPPGTERDAGRGEEEPRLPGTSERSAPGSGTEPPISIYSSERLERQWPREPNASVFGEDAAASPLAERDPPTNLPAVVASGRPASVEVRAAGSAPEPTLFRDPGPAAWWARLALVTLSTMTAWVAFGLFVLNSRIADFAAGTASPEDVQRAADLVNDRLRPAAAAVGVVTLLLLIRWTRRAYHNVRAFGKTDLRMRTSASVWGWLLPVANMVIVPLLLNDAWRAADVYARDDPRWRKRKGNRWTWFTFLALGLAAAITLLSVSATRATAQEAIDANRLLIGAAASLIVAAVAMARTVAMITHRQHGRLSMIRPGEPA